MQMPAETETAFDLVDADHPWPGLATFQEREAAFFKGRGQDIAKLYRLASRECLTVLCGVSGLGKSSLLQAGLFPRLRRDDILPVMIRLNFADAAVSLSAQVFAAIANQVKQHGLEAPVWRENETLWEFFHRQNSEFWDVRNRIVMPLLCFDQFEEIFTLGRETPERAADAERFIHELADLVEGRCPESVKARLDADLEASHSFGFEQHRYKLILSLREDYLANLEELRPLMPSLIHGRMRLRPMNGKQALDVVDQTDGRLIDRDVAERVVRLVAGKPGAQIQRALEDLHIEPALLSLLCRELNELRIKNHAARIGMQLIDRNRELILDAFYQRSLRDQTPELRRFIEDKLVTVSDYRNSEAYDNALRTPGITRQALDELVRRRLLVLRLESPDGIKRIELIHDVLTQVVCKYRDRRQMLEKQRQDEQARAAAEQIARAANRRALVFIGLAIIFLLTTAWGWWNWWDAKHSRLITQSGKLAAQAELLADTAADDRIVERAAVLAIESWRIQANPQAASAAGKLLRMLPKFRLRHDDSIRTIAFSPDGGLLATGGEGKLLRVFDSLTGAAIFSVKHDDWLNSIAFSPDRRLIATAGKGRQVNIIDLASHNILFSLSQDAEVIAVGFSPDGRLLATAGKDGTARLIDALTGKELTRFKHGEEVTNFAFSPDSRALATASMDKTARMMDIASGKELFRIRQSAGFTHIIISADGRYMATASLDNTAHVIDAATGRERMKIRHNEAVSSLAFSADGRWLATGSDDNTAKIMEVDSGRQLAQFTGRDDVFSVRFSPNARLLAISSLDGSARLIETDTWRELTRIPHGGAVWDIVFSPDSRLLATVGMDRLVRLVETEKYPDDINIEQQAGIMGLAFHPNGQYLATAGEDKTARVYDAKTGRQLMAFEHADTVYGVAFSRDGRSLASCSKDHTAKLVDFTSGQQIAQVEHAGEVIGIAFSPDSRWLATASLDKSVIVTDTHSGQTVKVIGAGDEVRFVAFSFDGQLLAIAGNDGAIVLIDTQTWRAVQTIRLSAAVSQLAFSPDNQVLATAGADQLARLFDWRGGREIARFAHAGTVLSIAFSPDGKRLATGSMDNTARLIDIGTGQLISLIKHGGMVMNIAFSGNGDFLATAGIDGITRIMETVSGQEINRISHHGKVWGVAFSPDPQPIVASAVSDGHVQLQAANPQPALDALCLKAGRNPDADELQDYLQQNPPHQTCPGWRMSAVPSVNPP